MSNHPDYHEDLVLVYFLDDEKIMVGMKMYDEIWLLFPPQWKKAEEEAGRVPIPRHKDMNSIYCNYDTLLMENSWRQADTKLSMDLIDWYGATPLGKAQQNAITIDSIQGENQPHLALPE